MRDARHAEDRRQRPLIPPSVALTDTIYYDGEARQERRGHCTPVWEGEASLMKKLLVTCTLALSLAGLGVAVTPETADAAPITYTCTHPTWGSVTDVRPNDLKHYTSQGWVCTKNR